MTNFDPLASNGQPVNRLSDVAPEAVEFDHRTPPRFHLCLNHQLPEDQMSPIGLVCPHCKPRLYVDYPQGRCASYWESQPAAYTLDRQPCFVYTLRWDDFQIRSLHASHSHDDIRGALALIHELPPQNDPR